jgi:hypothetical protein
MKKQKKILGMFSQFEADQISDLSKIHGGDVYCGTDASGCWDTHTWTERTLQNGTVIQDWDNVVWHCPSPKDSTN